MKDASLCVYLDVNNSVVVVLWFRLEVKFWGILGVLFL